MRTELLPRGSRFFRGRHWIYSKLDGSCVAKIGIGKVFFLLGVLLVSTSNWGAEKEPAPKGRDPLDEAQELVEAGKYEEALQKHIWLHDHVLEERPSYRGVRLSFALADWVELGKKYPKALTALKEIRERKAERLSKGEHKFELFVDVAAIDRYLDQSKATVVLFKQLEAGSQRFAGQIFGVAEGALVEGGEYTLARKYLGDPMVRLESARKSFASNLERIGTARTGSEKNARRSAYESIFSDEVVRMIKILKNTSEKELAERVQKEALKTLDDPRIRGAMK